MPPRTEAPPPSPERRRPNDRLEGILRKVGETNEPVSYKEMREIGREVDRTFANSAVDMVKSVSRVTRAFWGRLAKLMWPVAKRQARETARAAKIAAIMTVPGARETYTVYRGVKTAAELNARQVREREAQTQQLIEGLRRRAEEAERIAREALAASATRANASIQQPGASAAPPDTSPFQVIPHIEVVNPPVASAVAPTPEQPAREATAPANGGVVLDAASEIPPRPQA